MLSRILAERICMSDREKRGFFEELRRRNVFRVAIAFAIVSWLLLQVVDILVPMLSLPEWVGRLMLLMLVIAFPISLLLAWAFELTPDGVKLEKDVDRSESMVKNTGSKLDRLIIGVLTVAVIALAMGQFGDNASAPDDEVVTTEVQRSIAVMPFVDLSRSERRFFRQRHSRRIIEFTGAVSRFTSRSSNVGVCVRRPGHRFARRW